MKKPNNRLINDEYFKGQFGLEMESHRVTPDGRFAHTPHPFPDDSHISRDFSEDQIEVNTDPHESAEAALEELKAHFAKVRDELASMDEPEYLWPFSNPPYIEDEEDIKIAQFYGHESGSTDYREYLSNRYGKYLQTFSGIHVNYSFDDEFIRQINEDKNEFYLKLAEKAIKYGWIMVTLTAASPMLDDSFMNQGKFGGSHFSGMSSVRCSELGYWNYFTPIMDHSGIDEYIAGIQKYVDNGSLIAARELYYPIRLKPAGKYSLEALKEKGINHIELRMVDLNPLTEDGVDIRDVKFAQLFLIWLTSFEIEPLGMLGQMMAINNFKRAARYDIDAARISHEDGKTETVREAALNMLNDMEAYFGDYSQSVTEVLEYEKAKLLNDDNRYAPRVMQEYDEDFVERGLKKAIKR